MAKTKPAEEVYKKDRITITIRKDGYFWWWVKVHAITPLHPEGKVVYTDYTRTRMGAIDIVNGWGDCWLDQRCGGCNQLMTLDEEVDVPKHAGCIESYHMGQILHGITEHY